MYSEKLPVVLLSIIASEEAGTTNCQISNYILEHLEEIKNSSISQLSKKCHVANSSISRFCREIGLNDFVELREMLQVDIKGIQLYSEADCPNAYLRNFTKHVLESITRVMRSIDGRKLVKLVEDIHKYERVVILGMLKAETAAMNLQNDLFMMGKRTITKVSYRQQQECFSTLNEEQLFIIFSYTGAYFDYGFKKQFLMQNRKAKIYIITGNRLAESSDLYDGIIYFDSCQDYASHPYQLQLISSYIAQLYAYSMKESARM